jgi:hypothetical protein
MVLAVQHGHAPQSASDRRVPRHDVSALRRAHDLGIAIIERHPLQRSFLQNFHIAVILARHRKQ